MLEKMTELKRETDNLLAYWEWRELEYQRIEELTRYLAELWGSNEK